MKFLVDAKKLQALLDFYAHALKDDLISAVVADRDGLLLASKSKSEQVDSETVGGLSALIEPILKRMSTEFKSSGFGAMNFDTEQYRIIFTEAGKLAILVTILDLYANLDEIFPYAYICAEKVSRILDNREVSPVIPLLNTTDQLKVPVKQNEFQKISPTPGKYGFKIILGGDGAVGKTSLVNAFMQDTFKKDYLATLGTSIMKKECHFQGWDTVVRLIIWDLAGQQQFARVRQKYVQDARAGFLVFDLTRPETFANIEKWHKEVTSTGDDIILLLIGNKSDLVEQRKVTREEGENLAKKLGIGYFESSAKNRENVDEAFQMLAFKLIQKTINVE